MPVRISGATSGYVELAAPAVAGSVVMTLPATTGTFAVQGEAYGRSATATVATEQTTTSTSYTDLATAGPAVTVTTGTKALVTVYCRETNATSGTAAHISYAISGASTVAAADNFSFIVQTSASLLPQVAATAVFLVTGLTAGSNVFTAKYRAGASTAYFSNRTITVIDMGS